MGYIRMTARKLLRSSVPHGKRRKPIKEPLPEPEEDYGEYCHVCQHPTEDHLEKCTRFRYGALKNE